MTVEATSRRNTGRELAADELPGVVGDVLATTPFIDIHTHLFAPSFGTLGRWGIDDLLTYHYLEAELFRFSPVRPDEYWALTKPQRADLVWQTLFVDHTPLSEAARGVVSSLNALGLDTEAPSLGCLRQFFADQRLETYVPRIFGLAGVSHVVMTNDPLDDDETPAWNAGVEPDDRFLAALRLDRVLNEWESHYEQLTAQGFPAEKHPGTASVAAVRQFLAAWIARAKPVYLAVSLPDTFSFPTDDGRTRLLADAVLPACREFRLPLALMIGVRRQINPALRSAGDGAGRADMQVVGRLCEQFPDNRFMVSVLSRENQHELCVYARKFSNLLPFGCWWFLNTPSIVEEITRARLELLGTSFIPQHSDARILEQLTYKWRETRRTLTPILSGAYRRLMSDGRAVSRDDVQRDVERLFRGNFEHWTTTLS